MFDLVFEWVYVIEALRRLRNGTRLVVDAVAVDEPVAAVGGNVGADGRDAKLCSPGLEMDWIVVDVEICNVSV